MSGSQFFDEVDNEEYVSQEKPIWMFDHEDKEDEKKIHTWLKGEVNFLKQENQDRFTEIEKCLAMYKGFQFKNQETRHSRDGGGKGKASVQKVAVNNAFDLVQNQASKILRYKPAVVIMPADDEFSDKNAADMTKAWLDHIWYNEKFESKKFPVAVKVSRVYGEHYQFILYDKKKGDLHPDYVKHFKDKVDNGEKAPVLDENGNPELGEDGKPILVDKPVRSGDVTYVGKNALQVLVQRAESFEDADYIFYEEIIEIEKARLRYPDRVKNIVRDNSSQVWDSEKLTTRKLRANEILLWHFYHKRTDFWEQGRYIVFTNEGIAHTEKFPYSHRELPCERMTDVDMPGELHAISKLSMVRGLLGVATTLTNVRVKNLILTGSPKWVYAAGSLDVNDLGNDSTTVATKGPFPPRLLQANPNPPEAFGLQKEVDEKYQQLYGSFGISRGEPPPGIKAGVALQFLSEQENERMNEDVLKANEYIRLVAVKSIGVAGDYYDKDDQRKIRLLGKNNAYKTIFFDVTNLSKSYDIRAQNSSAFGNSKAAKTQNLLDIKEVVPTAISDEQFVDMLELGQDEKFKDIAAVSVQAAEAENELFMDPNPKMEVKEPEEYEDHPVHWIIHAQRIRNWSFKNTTPEANQEKAKDHLLATEMFMAEKMAVDPAYAELVRVRCPGFPLLFKMNAPVATPPPGAPMEEMPMEAPLSEEGMEPGLQIPPEMPVQMPDDGMEPEPVMGDAPPPLPSDSNLSA